jgi:hypothetical protein
MNEPLTESTVSWQWEADALALLVDAAGLHFKLGDQLSGVVAAPPGRPCCIRIQVKMTFTDVETFERCRP